MFRNLKIFFLVALVIGVFSLVFFLFYSTRTGYYQINAGKVSETQIFAILKTKYGNQGKQDFAKKLEEYIDSLRKNNGTKEKNVPSLDNKLNGVKENPTFMMNGGDNVDQLIQKSLEKSKPELHSEGDEPVESPVKVIDDKPTEQEASKPAPSDEEEEDLELCPEKPRSLTCRADVLSVGSSRRRNVCTAGYFLGFYSQAGPLYVNQVVPKMEELEKHLSEAYGGWVQKGGAWRPSNCKARVKMALIVPFRKRYEQLGIFVRHMHPMLKRQDLDYRIIIVDQSGTTPFNRAILFNIGYKESLKLKDFDCFIFHDVDLIPEDDRNMYNCPTSPRHMSVAVDKFNYQLPYASIFGGAGAFKKKHFEEVNGFSNKFWGWGGEDDDLYQRIVAKGFHLTRPSLQIGRYKMIRIHHHQSSKADPNSGAKLRNSRIRMLKDGLNSLKYKVLKTKEEPMYTIITVEVNEKWV